MTALSNVNAPRSANDLRSSVADASPATAPETGARGFSYVALSSLLRVMGAGVLLSALSIFLFQGWHDGGDLHRYGLLLVFTVALTGAGFGSSILIGENKGARLFLGIALCAVVVAFAVAGGLVYSAFGAPGFAGLPAFAAWSAGGEIAALAAGAGAIVVLAPVAALGFRVLARPAAGQLTGAFLAANTALLPPVRASEPVALLLCLLVATLLRRVVSAGRGHAALSTLEGRFARGVVFAPVAVIAGRALFFYDASTLLLTTLALLAFGGLREIGVQLLRSSWLRRVLDRTSVVAAVATALGTGTLVLDAFPASEAVWLPVCCLVLAGLLVELSLRSVISGAGLRRAASFVVAFGMLVNLVVLPSLASATLSLCVGLIVAVYGFSIEQKQVFGAGVATAVTGLAWQLWLVASLFSLGSWSSLAVLGAATIVLGSLLERHGPRLRERVGRWHERVSGWEA